VDTAMRLVRYFGTSRQYWLNLQNAYDLEIADRAKIEREVLPRTRHEAGNGERFPGGGNIATAISSSMAAV
jgi:plasmid maintenance system antidote protein VapI